MYVPCLGRNLCDSSSLSDNKDITYTQNNEVICVYMHLYVHTCVHVLYNIFLLGYDYRHIHIHTISHTYLMHAPYIQIRALTNAHTRTHTLEL